MRMIKTVRAAVEEIDEQDWQRIDYPQGGEAQIAETYGERRLIVRRTRLLGAQAELWPDWRHFCFITNRTETLAVVEAETANTPLWSRSSPISRTKHSRTFPPGVPRQRRVDSARRARAQHAPLDTAARTPEHHHPNRSHATPPTAQRPRPPDPPRPRLDGSPPRPLALARRLHHSAGPYPRAARPDLTAPRRVPRQRARPRLPGASPATANTARQPTAAHQLPRRAPIMLRDHTLPAAAEAPHPSTPPSHPTGGSGLRLGRASESLHDARVGHHGVQGALDASRLSSSPVTSSSYSSSSG